MLKFIHPEFVLNINNKGINEQEESTFFKDTFFSKFTLPFQFELTDELNSIFQNPISHIGERVEHYYEGYYLHYGKYEKAVLEINSIQGRKVSANIKYGIDELPNADTKLSDLKLEKKELNGSIIEDAEIVISKNYPATNYNYPEIYHEQLKDQEYYDDFKGSINKMESGSFVENVFDNSTNKLHLYNLMQPMPYLFHVLHTGLEDAGFEASGDFFETEILKKALIVTKSDYYATPIFNSFEFEMTTDEHYMTSLYSIYEYGLYEKEIEFPEEGVFKIAGNITLYRAWLVSHMRVHMRILKNGQEIWQAQRPKGGSSYDERLFTVDIDIEVRTGDVITIEGFGLSFGMAGNQYIPDANIADLTITQLVKFDLVGEPDSELNFVNDIRLAECVPGMTFGEFVTALKNWFNLDISPNGKVIEFNFIEDVYKNSEIIDISHLAVPEPTKELVRNESFLLTHPDFDSKYKFDQIFIDKDGARTTNIPKLDDVNEITINAVPLPTDVENKTYTADLFLEDKSILAIALYSSGIDNKTSTSEPLALINIYNKYWEEWINFRLSCIEFNWVMRLYAAELSKLDVKKRFYCYHQIHLIKTWNKRQISDDIWEIEIQTNA